MAARITEIKQNLDESLRDTSKPWTALLEYCESMTGINRLYIFVVSIALVALWLVFGFAAQLMCNFIGFLYPAYISIHAIESHRKDDDTKWLTYWVVFSIFSILEYFADYIVGWFPLYWLTKCTFLVWLMIPTEYNGSMVIYNKIVRPYFLKHHAVVDDAISHLKSSGTKLLQKTQ